MSDTPTLKLGKLPAEEQAYSFKLSSFLGDTGLPTPPTTFGHDELVGDPGMLANDIYGDCVWAGAAHETMLWTASVGKPAVFTDQAVLSDYSVVTGFVQGLASTDKGTNMEHAAKYRRKTGVVDEYGDRHKIDAYLELPGVSARGTNSSQLIESIGAAAYVFGAVGLGVAFPQSAMTQFNQGQPWTVVESSPIEGGHYVPVVGRRANGNFVIITWGRYHEVTPQFLLRYADEAVVYVSLATLKDGKTIDGFDFQGLQAALSALGGEKLEDPTPTPPIPVPAPEPTPPIPVPAPEPTPVPQPEPTPEPAPADDSDIALLDKWANAYHAGLNVKVAQAWKNIKAKHNL